MSRLPSTAEQYDEYCDRATGVHYYYDTVTGESRWRKPDGWWSVPPGWIGIVDKHDGRIYYYNTRTRETTWVRPGVSAVIQEPPQPKFSGELVGHTNKVTSVLELQDKTLLSSSLDTTLRRWDPMLGTCLQVYERTAMNDGHTDGITCVIQLRDGRLFSGGCDKTICVWDTSSGRCSHSIGKHPLAPVGNQERALLLRQELKPPLVAHNDVDRSYYHTAPVTALYEVLDQREEHPYDLTEEETYGNEWQKTVQTGLLVSGSGDLSVRLWNLASLSKDSDGNTIITCVRVLKDHGVVPGVLEGRHGHLAAIWKIGELTDGRLASGGCDGHINVWDLSVSPEAKHPNKAVKFQLTGRAFTELEDGRIITSSYSGLHFMWVWNITEVEEGFIEAERLKIEKEKAALKARMAESDPANKGKKAPAKKAPEKGKGKKGKKEPPPKPPPPEPEPVPPGQLNALRGHTGYVYKLAQIRDGRLISASADGTVRFWDVVAGEADQVLTGHTGEVSDVIQITDGRIVSSSHDHTLRIWVPPRMIHRENVKGRKVSAPDESPPDDLLEYREDAPW